jgi:DNA-binding response OmpR family regulator
VDDEAAVRDLLAANLQRAGYKVMCAGDVPQAEALVRDSRPDLVLLDWVLPGVPGLTFARRLRSDQRTKDISIVLLTARAEEQDKVTALESGADDYVTKPFSPRELAARVRSLLRRASGQADARSSLAFGDVVLDGDARQVRKAGDEVLLTAREFDLLWFLAANPRRVFSREQLMASVWGYEPALDSGTVTVHIRRLRTKVENDPARPRHLQTVWGVGYRLTP